MRRNITAGISVCLGIFICLLFPITTETIVEIYTQLELDVPFIITAPDDYYSTAGLATFFLCAVYCLSANFHNPFPFTAYFLAHYESTPENGEFCRSENQQG